MQADVLKSLCHTWAALPFPRAAMVFLADFINYSEGWRSWGEGVRGGESKGAAQEACLHRGRHWAGATSPLGTAEGV